MAADHLELPGERASRLHAYPQSLAGDGRSSRRKEKERQEKSGHYDSFRATGLCLRGSTDRGFEDFRDAIILARNSGRRQDTNSAGIEAQSRGVFPLRCGKVLRKPTKLWLG